MSASAQKSASLVVLGDAANLSPNQRLHWRTRAARAKKWRTQAKLLAAMELNWPPTPRRVKLSWLIRRARALDNANAYGSGALKAIEDGLVDAGLVPDDAAQWVEWGSVTQECGKQWRAVPQVVVTIEEITSEAIA